MFTRLSDMRLINRTSASPLAAIPTVRHVRRRPAARAQVHPGQARLVPRLVLQQHRQSRQSRQSRQHQFEMQLSRAGIKRLGGGDALNGYVQGHFGLVQSDDGLVKESYSFLFSQRQFPHKIFNRAMGLIGFCHEIADGT